MNLLVNFLVYTIGVPVLVGIICLFIPDKVRILAKFFAPATALLIFAASVRIFIFKPLYWPPAQDPVFVADNLSALAGLGIAFFALLVTVYSLSFIEKDNGRYFGCVLITLGGALGAVFANNLILLSIFWGILAATLYILVNMNRTEGAAAAAKKSIIIIGGTDAFMIFGIGLMGKLTGSFNMDQMHITLSGAFSYLAFLSIAIAAFAKAGVVPFHSWLPDVAQEAPAPVTAYLPASLDKLLGIYLLARISLNLFVMNNVSNMALLIIGALTIIYAVAMALVQHDFKRLLGYHAVSQVGYMVLGIGTANPVGIAGGLFHMLNNAVYKSCLFLGAGNVEKKTGTSDLDRLGGLAKYMPLTFISFLIASLSISGIPPFNGFVSKWMVYQGIIELGNNKNPLWVIWLICAMFGGALTIASFMKLLHAVFLGRPSGGLKNIREAGVLMLLPVIILAVICIVFGVFAFSIPLALFVIPAIGRETISYLGIWDPSLATALILSGILAGALIFFLLRRKKARSVGIFIGGEDPAALDRVTGTDFYDTIEDIKALRPIYGKEASGALDIYEGGKGLVSFFSGILQKLHNGILPTYLVWCLIGMIALFIALFLR